MASNDGARAATQVDTNALLAEAEQLVESYLRPSTRNNYQRIEQSYNDFCVQHFIVPYPASWTSLSSFVVSLLHRGTLKPRSIKSYMSAVLSRNSLLGHQIPQPIADRLEKLFQGIENERTESSGPEAIQPAMTSDLIIKLSRIAHGPNVNHDRNVSSVAATLFGFMFALRASTIIAVRRCDVELQPTRIVFREIKRKSHQTQTTRVVELPVDTCQPAKSLHKMLSTIFTTWKQPMDAPLFGFNNTEPAHAQVSNAIYIALATIGIDSVQLGLTSHSLRRGAAVSMYSLGTPMERILSWGAWKSPSSVQPYIKDRAWHVKSTTDQLCVAWMLH